MTAPTPKRRSQDLAGEEKPRCPKCRSKNIITMGRRGDRTLSCLDCDYAEGVGVA